MGRPASRRREAAVNGARSQAGPPSLPVRCEGCAIPFSLLSPRRRTKRIGEEGPSGAVLVSLLSKMSSSSKRREMDLMKL